MGGQSFADDTVNTYSPLFGAFGSATETSAQSEMTVSGTMSNLRVRVTQPGTGADSATDSYLFTIRKNGGPTALSCSVTGAAVRCEDNDSVTFAVGDLIALETDPTGTPANNAVVRWTVKFTR